MNIHFSYENQNQYSYLLASFPPEEKIVQYQLQMMTSNEIHGLLPSMKRQSNESILIYYQITSKLSLEQILSRRKLSRNEFLGLLSGTVATWKEVQEYQLESQGLYLEPKYIFVTSGTCEPSFVFLPIYTSSQGVENLKGFIQQMILKGTVEITSDNFIQRLLNIINEEDFGIQKLEDCIQSLRGEKETKEAAAEVRLAPPVTSSQPAVPESTVKPPVSFPEPPSVAGVKIERAELPKPKKGKKEKQAGVNQEKGKEKGKFILFQAVFLVCIAALFSFHAFTDSQTGELLTQNILAAILILAALEFVVYRELFVNKKEEKKPKKKKGTKKPAGVQREKTVEIPGKAAEKPTVSRPVIPTPVRPAAPPVPIRVPVYTESSISESPSMDTDETDFWDPSQISEAYLEYLEDGKAVKIPLQKVSVFLGRMASQVDFAVHNPKVGKIHAEILCQGGYYYIKDLNSKNGTYINGNGERITSNVPYPLANGDRIALADSEFVLHC